MERDRERERDGEGEGAFDGSGLMQSAMQPFRASDRAAFATAFGSFGHAPLRIEASHRQAAHILMAWRGVAWHGMAWPALWLAGSSERHACRAPTIPTFFNPSPSRLSAQPRRKAPQPGEQHADSRQARAPAAIKSQSQKKMCWTQRGKQGFECTRPFAISPAAVHSRAGASLSLSKLAGRQPVQAALPIATSEPSCRRCVVRPARKFTLPTSAPYRCVPSPTCCRCQDEQALGLAHAPASCQASSWIFGSGASGIGQAVRTVPLWAPLRRPRRSQPSFPTQSEPSSVQPASWHPSPLRTSTT